MRMDDFAAAGRDGGHGADREGALPPGFLHRGIAILGIALAGVLVVTLFWLAVDVFLVVFAGILLAVFLRALGDFVAKHTPLSEGWGLGLGIATLLVAFAGGVALLLPQLAAQFDEFSARIPAILAEVEKFLEEYGWGRQLLGAVEDGGADGGGIAAGLAGFLGVLGRIATHLVAFLFIGLFLAIHPKLYVDGAVKLFPIARRNRTRAILAEIGYMLRWFLVARAIAMALVGITTGIALALLGVPLALLLGFITALLTFVPYLGPVIAGIPILAVALLEGTTTAIWVLVAYTAIQQVEGNIFDPLILKRIIHLPPAVTVGAQILGSALLGVLGLALATPFAAVMQVIVRRVYREDLLGEPKEPLEHES